MRRICDLSFSIEDAEEISKFGFMSLIHQMKLTVSWSPSEHLPKVFLGGQIRFTLTVSPLCLVDIILYTVPKV